MKRFSSIITDVLIILFIGFCGGLVDILFTFYKDEMINKIMLGIFIGIVIGTSIMIVNIILYKYKGNIPFYKVSAILLIINAIGILSVSYFTHNNNYYKVITIFLMTTIITNYVLYNKRKLDKQFSHFLKIKKLELELIQK